MASEYLKWKYRDVKPRETKELTPAEKRKNWWHYHKWHILTGVVLAAALALIMSRAIKIFSKVFHRYDGLNASVQENTSAIRVVKAFVREGYENKNGAGITGFTQAAPLPEQFIFRRRNLK